MQRIISLTLITVLLSACAVPLLHRNEQFTCHYKNLTTHKEYWFTANDRYSALSHAQKACRKAPVEWRCYFVRCDEMKVLPKP